MKEKITPNFLGLIQQVNFGNLPLLKRCGSTVIYFYIFLINCVLKSFCNIEMYNYCERYKNYSNRKEIEILLKVSVKKILTVICLIKKYI